MTSHELANYGFVAVDDLIFQQFEDCGIQPASAAPTTTTTTTTPPTTTEQYITECTFQDDTCGWEISGNEGEFFSWNRTNGQLLNEQGLEPHVDHLEYDTGTNKMVDHSRFIQIYCKIAQLYHCSNWHFCLRLLYVRQSNVCERRWKCRLHVEPAFSTKRTMLHILLHDACKFISQEYISIIY